MARKLNFLFVSALLFAQTPAPEVDARESQPTFTTRSNLVLVRVVVRDKKGLPNGTLRSEDFQVFDKGKPHLFRNSLLSILVVVIQGKRL